MPWTFSSWQATSTVAGKHPTLHVYSGQNFPGQPWRCYRSHSEDEKPEDADLGARSGDLLTRSTTPEDLDMIERRTGANYCAYPRFKQKSMAQYFWLVGGQLHNGAHYPLCVFTKNSGGRSAAATTGRSLRNDFGITSRTDHMGQKGPKGGGKTKEDTGGSGYRGDTTAVAGPIYGKGKGNGKSTIT